MAIEDDRKFAKDYEEDATRVNEMCRKAKEMGHLDPTLFPEDVRKPPLLNKDGGLLNQPKLADNSDDEEDDDAGEY